jgi:hypothetical protein
MIGGPLGWLAVPAGTASQTQVVTDVCEQES